MDKDLDLTGVFRETESVQEYLLIGPEKLCGYPESWEEPSGFTKQAIPIPPNALSLNIIHLDNTYHLRLHTLETSHRP